MIAFMGLNRCSGRRSHRCKCAGIRRRIQENVVTRVDQHLKHLKGEENKTKSTKSEGEERGWRHWGLGQIPYTAPPGSRWSHTCPSVRSQGCGWLWAGCEGSSVGSSSTSAAQVSCRTADVIIIIIIILKSPSGLNPICTKFNILLLVSAPSALTPHPLEAEYCSALFIVTSLKVTFSPFFSSMVAERKGKVLGLGAPPAREIRDGGERCCSSATRRWDARNQEETQPKKLERLCRKKYKFDLEGTTNYMEK